MNSSDDLEWNFVKDLKHETVKTRFTSLRGRLEFPSTNIVNMDVNVSYFHFLSDLKFNFSFPSQFLDNWPLDIWEKFDILYGLEAANCREFLFQGNLVVDKETLNSRRNRIFLIMFIEKLLMIETVKGHFLVKLFVILMSQINQITYSRPTAVVSWH